MKISRDTLLLVKSIGLPELVEGEPQPLNKALSLLQLAKLNKIPLLFLESQRKFRNYPPLQAQLSHYRDKHKETLDLTALVSSLLEESGMHYTIFKTLKPFPYTPADIDVLLWSNRDLTEASQILKKKGLKLLDRDSFGLTMFSVDYDINVDLTTEVGASSFIYLDKSSLFEHSCQVKDNGYKVQTPQPYVDLVVVAAHCMYKEQMYTLSDYYTFALSSQYYQEALEFAKKTHAKFALETALKLTHDITINSFGSDNAVAKRLRNSLQGIGMSRMIRIDKNLDLPVKYPSRIVLRGLLEKIREDRNTRNSLPIALKSTLQPKSINRLLTHIKRKGY